MMTPAEQAAKKKGKKPFRTAKGVDAKLNCRLREFRDALGLSQREVATGADISYAVICRAEHGMEVWVGTALRIAKFFGKSIEEIWSRKP